MKPIVIYICLSLILIAIISLSVYFFTRDSTCNRIHLDDNTKLWGEYDLVPDEETAKRVADIIISAQSGFYEGLDYDVEITYKEDSNEWDVCYHPIVSDGMYLFDGTIEILIRRDCGMVTELDFYK